MKKLFISLIVTATINVFAEDTAVPFKCSFDNNGKNRKEVLLSSVDMNGNPTGQYVFKGSAMSVTWLPGSEYDTQTALLMTLNGVRSAVYNVNLERASGPINVMTAENGLIRFQCYVP